MKLLNMLPSILLLALVGYGIYLLFFAREGFDMSSTNVTYIVIGVVGIIGVAVFLTMYS